MHALGGPGLGAHGRAIGLKSIGSGRGGEQGTGSGSLQELGSGGGGSGLERRQ